MGRRRKGHSEPSGIFVVDKPEGWTSHDVVGAIRGRGRLAKVGHTGTLDPFATGVLPICLNRATRLSAMLTDGVKGYEATLKLGIRTDTLDRTGEVIAEAPVPEGLTTVDLREAALAFTGEITQKPPMYSAVKVGGKRLHTLARAGKEVERPSRQVWVKTFDILSFKGDVVEIRLLVSKGTYVRVLAEDLGLALGCGAHVTELRRTRAGPFTLSQAQPLEPLLAQLAEGDLSGGLLPLESVAAELPRLVLNEEGAHRARNGAPMRHRDVKEGPREWPEGLGFWVYGPDGVLLGMGKITQPGRLGRLAKVLAPVVSG